MRRRAAVLAGMSLATAVGLRLAAGQAATPITHAPPPVPARAVRSGDLKDLQAWLKARRGRPVLLAFWATWCGPCVEEVPALNEALERFRGHGLAVMGVSLDAITGGETKAGREKVERFVRKHRIAYETFYYEGSPDPIAEAFSLPGPIPYIMVLGVRGEVKQTLLGSIPKDVLLRRVGEAIGAWTKAAREEPKRESR